MLTHLFLVVNIYISQIPGLYFVSFAHMYSILQLFEFTVLSSIPYFFLLKIFKYLLNIFK